MSRLIVYATGFILLLLTLIIFPPILTEGDLGLCVASPNEWHIPKFPGWLINSILIFLSVAVMASANKKYNFIPEAEPVMPMAMVLLLATNCLTTATLTTSTLLLFINALALFIIITTYEEMNTTREFFIIGTLPAIGAMFQYSFLVMIPVYIGGGLLMKSFRIRELIAFIFGLAAPYWIALGMGMVKPEAFHMPGTLTVFRSETIDQDILMTLIAAGVMSLAGFILSLYNGVRLFNRNSRLRCIHMTFNLMGYASILAIIFNFNNFTAYFGTLALWVAIETALLLHLYEIRNYRIPLIVLFLIFLPLYIISL